MSSASVLNVLFLFTSFKNPLSSATVSLFHSLKGSGLFLLEQNRLSWKYYLVWRCSQRAERSCKSERKSSTVITIELSFVNTCVTSPVICPSIWMVAYENEKIQEILVIIKVLCVTLLV